MSSDPSGPLRTADTVLTHNIMWQILTTPPELQSAFASSPYLPLIIGSPRCITKPSGLLLFVLNSVLDLGFPAALDFDITFVGTLTQPATPSTVAVFRFDVNQSVQATFALPGGPSVFVDTVTGSIRLWAVRPQPGSPLSTMGTSCLGQPRTFDVAFGWGGPGAVLPSPFATTDLTVTMSINGQQRALTLYLGFMYAHAGVPPLGGILSLPPVVDPLTLLRYIIFHIPGPPPPPFREALEDAILALANAQSAWAIHARADGRRLQQVALDVAEAALKRMRTIADEDVGAKEG